MQENVKWPALESDPTIFTNYFHTIGVDKSVFFKELLTLDYKEFMFFEGPILGVILIFQQDINKTTFDDTQYVDTKSLPFYMKQTPKLDHACGLIAALHILGNSQHLVFDEGSLLQTFFSEGKEVSHEERAKKLEETKKFNDLHKNFAGKGQSSVPKEGVNNHYVAFINYEGNVYELDGCKKSPVILQKNVMYNDFLDVVIDEVKRRINNNEIKDRINLFICCDENTRLVDFLTDY